MKTLLLIPLAVSVAMAAAASLCWLAGLPPHMADLLAAAVVAVVAAELGVIPAYIFRESQPTTRASAALGGTVLHLLLTILLAAAVMVARGVDLARPFVYWLVGAYWLSLVMLVLALIKLTPRNPLSKRV